MYVENLKLITKPFTWTNRCFGYHK